MARGGGIYFVSAGTDFSAGGVFSTAAGARPCPISTSLNAVCWRVVVLAVVVTAGAGGGEFVAGGEFVRLCVFTSTTFDPGRERGRRAAVVFDVTDCS